MRSFRRRSRRTQNFEEDLVNLTPLIDVIFVVLLMFILIAPIISLQNVELAGGNKESLEKLISPKDKLQIYVNEDNTVWVKDQEINLIQLERLLELAKQQHPTMRLQLFQDRRSQFGVYQKVKSLAQQAGFDTIDVILKPV
jgi:biopolymer transport protein ExbD